MSKEQVVVLERTIEALEGVVRTLVGMQGIIPAGWIQDDVNNVHKAREALDKLLAMGSGWWYQVRAPDGMTHVWDVAQWDTAKDALDAGAAYVRMIDTMSR